MAKIKKWLESKKNKLTFSASNPSRAHLIVYGLVFGVVGSVIIGLSFASTNSFSNVLNNPINPNNLLNVPFGSHSDYVQTWRAYMDTVPASDLVDAVGINFNVSGNTVEPTARVLAASGFKRARIEISWNGLDYNDPTKLTASTEAKIQQYATTFKKYGIRPLICLNANSGGPVPALIFKVTVTQPAKAGDTTIKLDPSIIPQIKLNYSGSQFGDTKAPQAKYRITSISADGTAKLSFPLKVDVPANTYSAATQRFQPFFSAAKDDGSPSPEFNATMNGWLDYVGAVTKAMKQYYGSDDFDVEVWNELSFGSAFLSYSNYFSPLPAGYSKGANANGTILEKTINYLHNPANGVPRIKVGNGFSNQSPWGSGKNSPVGLDAIDKHPYAGLHRRPYEGQLGYPIDATGQKDPTAVRGCWQKYDHTKAAPYTDTNANGKYDLNEPCTGDAGMFSAKEPAYNAFFPEYFINGVQTETLIRDLAPFENMIQGTPHGRYTKPCDTCKPPVMWFTEVNLGPSSGGMTDPSEPNFGGLKFFTISAEESRHIASKNLLRYLTVYINKGVKAIHFYAANAGNLSVIDASFFNLLNANDIKHNPSYYPGDNTGGASLAAIKNLTDIMKQGAAAITQPRQLTLSKIADNHNHMQFDKTDDTASHPPLYDRDVLAVLPFQINNNRFAIPAYVMTRNTAKIYNANAPADGSKFDLPPEAFQLTLGGFDSGKTYTASAVDPLTNTATPASIVEQSGGTLVVQATLTDSPRVIIIDVAGSSSSTAPVDTTPPDTLISVYPTGSREKTEATFSFTSTEINSTFECQMDSSAFSSCTSPKTYSNVAPGTHSFGVRAIDSAGNKDPTPAIHNFTFTAPQTSSTLTPPVNLHVTSSTASSVGLAWTGSAGSSSYNIYRNNIKINTSPITGTSYSDTTVSGSKTYTYAAEAVDSSGNVSVKSDTLTVTTPAVQSQKRGDITGPSNEPDGSINIFDLSYIIRNYNTNNSNADITGSNNQPDGVVDIFDLSYVIRNYGK